MKNTITAVAALVLGLPALGQQAQQGQTAFSLDQAVAYGLEHSVQVRNATTDYKTSRNRVGEIRAAGLPQINASAGFQHNPNKLIQRFVLEYGPGTAAFTGGQALPADANGKPFGLGLSLPNTGSANIQLTQLLFSGSYLLGLRAASVYTDLTSKQVQQARIAQKSEIMKAYYQAMVGQEQSKLLDYNLARIDTTLRNTQALFKNGFAENIDVYRLEVQRNNLLADKENTMRQIDLAISALKFAMGYPIEQPLTITDKLENAKLDASIKADGYGAYDQRIEYSILSTQEELAKLDLKNKKAGYLPTLLGSASLGALSAASQGINIFKEIPGKWQSSENPALEGQRWYGNAVLGVQLNVPIFDGGEKHYQIQQSKLQLQKVRDSRELLKNSIDFEVDRANISAANARSRVATQERNLALAKEVVRVTRIKYQQGVGSSLEVTNAETDLRVAQTNYYAALYDALVAKVDADVATGRISAQ